MSEPLQPLSVSPGTAFLLLNPQAWIDPQRRRLLDIAPDLPVQVANLLILHRAKLKPVTMSDLTHPHLALLSKVWPVIPVLAYLIGARCLRAQIFANNAWGQLRYRAGDFLSLPLPLKLNGPVSVNADQFDLEGEIFAVGRYCIEQAVEPTPGWRERLLWRLPPVTSTLQTFFNKLSPALCRQLLDCAISFHDTAT